VGGVLKSIVRSGERDVLLTLVSVSKRQPVHRIGLAKRALLVSCLPEESDSGYWRLSYRIPQSRACRPFRCLHIREGDTPRAFGVPPRIGRAPKRPARARIEEYDKDNRHVSESDSSGRQLTSNARFAKAMAMYWLALAYTNQRKQDIALSAADNAFSIPPPTCTAPTNWPDRLRPRLQAAKISQQQQLIAIWQKRLNDLQYLRIPARLQRIGNPKCSHQRQLTNPHANSQVPSGRYAARYRASVDQTVALRTS